MKGYENFYQKIRLVYLSLILTSLFLDYSFPSLEDNAETVAAIMCSSGTTGLSKGVQISHAQLFKMTEMMSQFQVGTCFSSIYWLSGFIALVSGTYYGLKRIITHQSFSPRIFIELVETYKIQAIITGPTHVGLLLRYPGLKMADFSSVRGMVITGGVAQEHLRKQMQEYLLSGVVIVAYGMTEAAGLFTSTMPFDKPSLSIGRPTKDIDLKVNLY
jgi:4-coumarate--CoA ligase